MRLNNLEMLQLMPKFMREDEAVIALCKSVDAIIRNAAKEIEKLPIWNVIDILDGKTLDELAWELDIDWWETSWSLQEKRETIRTAFKILDSRGTKGAVIHAISNAFGSGYVEEWFEYSGEPFHFMAGTEEILTEEKMNKFMKLVEIAKNVRSVLDVVATMREVESDCYIGTTVYNSMELEV